ncbi:beta carbonic anhydrase 5, chloroplastic isoform X1 [Silene latifolia]|uniref:beta carbonic anhydrase 5, chloroplastic isoform X1 n=1 Tax=Silene latifolia TaxID=37657 RepID=UPI003D77722B
MAVNHHFSLLSSSLDLSKTPQIFGQTLKLGEIKLTHFRLSPNFSRIRPSLSLKGSRIPEALTIDAESTMEKMVEETSIGSDPFCGMKQNFLSFKREKYLENLEHFQNLAKIQTPKFTVIACADSRVCPSNILGLQPGDAFTVRQVANLVPPFESGPTETKAALEFSVNALEVENILVIGHSCCGGIRALMTLEEEDENSRSFIRNWVFVGKNARVSTKSVASHLDIDQQCQHCEKESINHSLMNLLTYPWIKERVAKGKLSLHGGYYDFTDCTFEKWTLDCDGTVPDGSNFAIKNREFWS